MRGNLPEETGKGQRYAIASSSQYGREQDAGKMMRRGSAWELPEEISGSVLGGVGTMKIESRRWGYPKVNFDFT